MRDRFVRRLSFKVPRSSCWPPSCRTALAAVVAAPKSAPLEHPHHAHALTGVREPSCAARTGQNSACACVSAERPAQPERPVQVAGRQARRAARLDPEGRAPRRARAEPLEPSPWARQGQPPVPPEQALTAGQVQDPRARRRRWTPERLMPLLLRQTLAEFLQQLLPRHDLARAAAAGGHVHLVKVGSANAAHVAPLGLLLAHLGG